MLRLANLFRLIVLAALLGATNLSHAAILRVAPQHSMSS